MDGDISMSSLKMEPKKLINPNQYLYIKVWGYEMGSYDYYIKNQQDQAAEDQAPIDALFYHKESFDGPRVWSTAREILDLSARNRFDQSCRACGISAPDWSAVDIDRDAGRDNPIVPHHNA